MKIGAGGWITDIAIAPNGRQYCQTDTYGIYGRASSELSWELLTTTTSMGSELGYNSGDLRKSNATGIYALALAPSSPTTVYVMFWDGTLYKSTDAGGAWTNKTGTLPALSDIDFTGRFNGPRMAVNPTDPSHVFIVTEDGTFETTDGATTWTKRTDLLDPTSAAGGRVAWHPGDATKVYIAVAGRGVYASSDTGVNFSLTSSGPTSFRRMAVGSNGVLFATDVSDQSNLWVYSSGAWSAKSVATGQGNIHSVAPDPNNAGHWYIADDSGQIAYTANDGGSFTAFFAGTRVAASPQPVWHQNTNEAYMSNGNMAFDPSLSNTLFFSMGIGVWKATPPTSSGAFNWNADSIGIEQLVTQWIDVPPGGTPIISCWDRPIFKLLSNNSDYPANHGVNYTYSIMHGWSWDWAKSDPTFIAVVGTRHFSGSGTALCQLGYSEDSGATWAEAAGAPSGTTIAGGSIAVATPDNWIYCEHGSDARLRYTNNKGATFGFSTISGVPTSGFNGFGVISFAHRRSLCCDDDGYFYLYTNGTESDDSSAGVWKSNSPNDGSAFTKVFSGRLITGADTAQSYAFNSYHFVMNAMPGVAGVLFATAGDIGGGIGGKFFRSMDAGVTWVDVPDVLEVQSFGFGKANAAGDPTLHMTGWVDGEYGVWVSENATAATIGNITWSKKTDYPLGRADEVTTVSGDMNTYGVTYVGYRGSGAVRGVWA